MNIEIALARGGRADADALVGKAHMHGIGVGGGVHHDAGNAELFAGPKDPKGDFPAIGDEDFRNHGLGPIR